MKRSWPELELELTYDNKLCNDEIKLEEQVIFAVMIRSLPPWMIRIPE